MNAYRSSFITAKRPASRNQILGENVNMKLIERNRIRQHIIYHTKTTNLTHYYKYNLKNLILCMDHLYTTKN